MKFIYFFSLLITFFSFSNTLTAQVKTGILKGKLVDSTSKQSFRNATITVLSKIDSSVVTYGLTQANGTFEITNIPFGEYNFLVSFIGYQSIQDRFIVTAITPTFNTGTIYLIRPSNVLKEVVIKAAPVAIKGDTTEFDAGQYKTIPNATTEDLLKKLPGVEVEKDGSITAQGTAVTRVLVDGKRFFGNDPKMATKNLPADIIEKIQVIDAMSDQSAFSGFDDGDRVRTINIITKKDRRKGVFGKGSAAAGDNERYAASVSANRFNGNQQVSVIAQTNNINSQNFSIQDFLGANSGGGNGGGGKSSGSKGGNSSGSSNRSSGTITATSPGLSTTAAAGLNYNDVWGKNTQINGSYFYNSVNAAYNTNSLRETFDSAHNSDSSLFNTNQNSSLNNNKNHRFNFEIDQRFDSANSLLIRPEYSYQHTNNYSENYTTTTKGISPLSNIHSIVASQNEGYNFNNSILFRHRFNKPGRTLSLNLTQAFNTNDRTGTNLSENQYYTRGVDTINQASVTNRDGKSYGANVSYTERLGQRSQVELTYNYNHNENNSDKKTFQMNRLTGKTDIVVPNLTNLFENTNISQRAGINFRTQLNKDWNYSIGMAVQKADLTSNNLTKGSFLSHSFYNLFPNFNIQYRKVRAANFRFSYRGSTQQPSISQLQDVIDNTNLLNIKSGNPSLKQEFNNNFSLSYTSFNISTFKIFTLNINGGEVSNKISNAVTINSRRDTILVEGYKVIPGGQFTKPVNLNGAFDANLHVMYGFPLKLKKTNISLTGRASFSHNINLINSIQASTDNYVYGGTAKLTMNLKERFDLNFSSTSTFNSTRYSNNAQQNGNYFTQRIIAEPTYSSKSGWILSTDMDYIINSGQAEGFNQAIPLWNAGIAKLFLRNQAAEIRFSVFDILNQNKSITRDVEVNYIEDIRSQVLNRYFLLSFTFNLKKFKGQKDQDRNSFKDLRKSGMDEDRRSHGSMGSGRQSRERN